MIKLIDKKFTKLITIFFAGTLYTPLAVALPVSNKLTDSFKIQKNQLLNSSLSKIKDDSELTISPGELHLMTHELEGLIGRFKATLLTADAIDSDLDISTGFLIQPVSESPTITRRENTKLAQSNYQNSHRALQLADQRRQNFNYLIEQRQYAEAKAEWDAAKQVLWNNYPKDRSIAQSY